MNQPHKLGRCWTCESELDSYLVGYCRVCRHHRNIELAQEIEQRIERRERISYSRLHRRFYSDDPLPVPVLGH